MCRGDKCHDGTYVVGTNVVIGHMSCKDMCRVRTFVVLGHMSWGQMS